jgi:hypothetical protein
MAKRSLTWDSALAPFRPLIMAQGEVTYAYNLLQEGFFRTFVYAMTIERPDDFRNRPEFYSYVNALWHSFPGDNSQRLFALTALRSIPTKLDIKPGVEGLEWARKMTDRLAGYRGIMAQTPQELNPCRA